jgi:hypothetical protein
MIRLPTDVEIPTLPLVYAYTKADLIFVILINKLIYYYLKNLFQFVTVDIKYLLRFFGEVDTAGGSGSFKITKSLFFL